MIVVEAIPVFAIPGAYKGQRNLHSRFGLEWGPDMIRGQIILARALTIDYPPG
jgi:hypothetical protein